MRSLASSFVRMRETWDLQVSGLMKRRSAISPLVKPAAMRRSISTSRLDRERENQQSRVHQRGTQHRQRDFAENPQGGGADAPGGVGGSVVECLTELGGERLRRPHTAP